MTHHLAVESIKRQYLWIDLHFNSIFAKCATDAERDGFRRAYVGSRDNLWEARSRIFLDHDPATKAVLAEFQANQAQIEAMWEAGSCEGLFALIATNVSLGSRLVTTGSAPAV